jgi:hypothetical protein
MLFRKRTLGAALSFTILSFLTETAAAAPSVALGRNDVQISGITPKGAVVVVSFGRGTSAAGGIAVRVFREYVKDDDGDGVITVLPGYAIPFRSVWVVVDFESGQYAIASPADFSAVTGELSLNAMKEDEVGGTAFLEMDRVRTALLLVRPGKDAWFHVGHLGREGDAKKSGERDALTLAFADGVSLLPESKSKGPKHLQRGDVLIAIDPGQLEVFSAQVTK